MASNEMWDAPDIVPSITFADVPRAIEWLERVFGFRERKEARLTWPGGGMTWIEAGNGLFNISTLDETWQLPKTGASGSVIKVYVEDVDRHFDRAKAQGAKIVSEPQDGFWGGRIYRALDHEGHRWEISQRGRDLSAERWQLPPGVTRGVSK
ncbi:MAG: VOC family protein [Vicinamibacteria bacterium]